jgi:hypothetical protein
MGDRCFLKHLGRVVVLVTFFRWEYFSQKAVEQQTLPRNITLPAGLVFIVVAIYWCGFCSLPLLMLLVNCSA